MVVSENFLSFWILGISLSDESSALLVKDILLIGFSDLVGNIFAALSAVSFGGNSSLLGFSDLVLGWGFFTSLVEALSLVRGSWGVLFSFMGLGSSSTVSVSSSCSWFSVWLLLVWVGARVWL